MLFKNSTSVRTGLDDTSKFDNGFSNIVGWSMGLSHLIARKLSQWIFLGRVTEGQFGRF